MEIITLEDLASAIKNRIGIDMEEALNDANFLMDLFGFEDRIIDNILEPEDRQLFYILEEERMLMTEREETTIYDGRVWRTHYWILNQKIIHRYQKEEREKEKRKKEKREGTIYEEIPEEAWKRRGRGN